MILIIGGTAAYHLNLEQELGTIERIERDTPYGKAFPIFLLQQYDQKVAFASRHGLGQLELTPPFVNAQANIWAAYELGVTAILGWNGVGAINPLLEVHDMVMPNGILDFTKTRKRAFDAVEIPQDASLSGGDNVVGAKPAAPSHAANPHRETLHATSLQHAMQPAYIFDTTLSQALYRTARARRTRVFPHGVYVCSEGPRLETRAEIAMYRQLGADIVGMTLVPEIFLAQSLGIAYASVAYITNYATGVEPVGDAPRHFGVDVAQLCLRMILETIASL